MINYSIITTTYLRPEGLLKAMYSVFDQDYGAVEMIIVNDSPDYDYSTFEENVRVRELIKKSQIRYVKNSTNMGSNFSRNLGLSLVSKDADFIVFLDDDDWLIESCFVKISNFLNSNPRVDWLILDSYLDGKLLNSIKKQKSTYSYFIDYLLFKNIKGDCMHVIRSDASLQKRFCGFIKNGEEWFYFIQLPYQIRYVSIPGKIIGGYFEGGLTNTTRDSYKINTWILYNKTPWSQIRIKLYLILRIMCVIFWR